MANFPGSLSSIPTSTAGQTLALAAGIGHTALHNLIAGEILAVQTKVGTGSSTPTANKVLRGTGAGTSTWGQVDLTADVTGVLPVGSGGVGQTNLTFPTGPTTLVGRDTTDTLTNKTLTTPTIANFTNSQHTHANAAGGGQLTGSSALVNSTVTADKLNTGAQTANVATSETTTSLSYTDLATAGPSVTVTIGANGLALVCIHSSIQNNTNNQSSFVGFAVSGANTIAATSNDNLAFGLSGAANQVSVFGTAILLTGLTAGSTTFTLKYVVNGGTGTFASRRISVVPL